MISEVRVADELPRHGYTVAALCHRWKVGADKVRALIRRGELVAVNLALHLSAKPQWRVMPEEVERFETRRTSAPPPNPPRRKKRTGEIDFFPD
jgi:hypothetical protein